MLFGHNSNVKVGDATFHVQTEDRGVTTALIDTTVYYGGRVMHRRTNNYHDLIPLDPDREEALRLRLDEQHRSTLEDIRTGALHLVPPQPPAPVGPRSAPLPGRTSTPVTHAPETPVPAPHANETHAVTPPSAITAPPSETIPTPAPAALRIILRNARTWLSGKQARLELSVSSATGNPQPGAKVIAYIEGAATAEKYSAETNTDGSAEISFTMPRLTAGEAALVIDAQQTHADSQKNGAARGRLRFALRTKPRTT